MASKRSSNQAIWLKSWASRSSWHLPDLDSQGLQSSSGPDWAAAKTSPHRSKCRLWASGGSFLEGPARSGMEPIHQLFCHPTRPQPPLPGLADGQLLGAQAGQRLLPRRRPGHRSSTRGRSHLRTPFAVPTRPGRATCVRPGVAPKEKVGTGSRIGSGHSAFRFGRLCTPSGRASPRHPGLYS